MLQSMPTEKIYTQGWVTAECLAGTLGGPEVVFDYFRRNLALWAANNHMFIATPIKVHVRMPSLLGEAWELGCVEVVAIARAIKVTPITEETCC